MLRIGLLRFAAALLYVGPILAGAMHLSWSAVLPFAAIFLLWLVVIRPQDWPEDPRAWLALPAWLALAGRALVQVMLVGLCFLLGRAIGQFVPLEPVIGGGVPLTLSFLAVPLARMVWNPAQAVAMDRLLDDALRDLAAPPVAPGGAALPAGNFHALFDAFHALPVDADLAQAVALLDRLPPDTNHEALYDALLAEVQENPFTWPLRAAVVHYATSQPCAQACPGRGAPVRALQLAAGDDRLLALVARRCILLLQADADAWGDCPNTAALEAARIGAGPRAAAALADLIDLNRRLAPLNGLDSAS